MMKGISGTENWTTLTYPTNVDLPWRLIRDFIRKQGKFIGAVRFEIGVGEFDQLHRTKLPQDFIPQILLYCPNLRDLRLDGCIVKELVYSEADYKKKLSINQLFFQRCQIHHSVFVHLSTFLCNIQQLRLCCYKLYTPGNEAHIDNSHFMITMPYTNIECIKFEGRSFYFSKSFTANIFLSTNGKSHSYHGETFRQEPLYIEEARTEDCSVERNIYVTCLSNSIIETSSLPHTL